jgi:hypothetical protein
VAADGSLIVADPGAATNMGVTRLKIGGFNVDAGTDPKVSGFAHAGTSFQLSPDGGAIAVLDGAARNLSACVIISNNVEPEVKLVTARAAAATWSSRRGG